MVKKQVDVLFNFLTKGMAETTAQIQRQNKSIKKLADTKQINKLGQKYNSFGGVMKMPLDKFKKFNQEGGQFNKRSARMGNGLRKMTHGLRGFRMEMLGVMFFGMMMQKTLMGLIKPALQMSGAMELLSTILGLMFLPIGLQLIDWIMKLWNWWDNASEATKGFWRTVVVAGIALGGFLMVVGQFALGLGSIIQVFGGFIGWFFNLIGVIVSIFGPWILFIGLLFGLAVPLAAAGDATEEFGEKQKGVWTSIKDFIAGKIQGILEWMDTMWEKFLDWEPVNAFLINMGLTQEAIERLKNPLFEIKNFIDNMWTKWVKENPKVIALLNKLGIYIGDLETPFTFLKAVWREIWNQVQIYWTKLMDLIKNDEFIQGLIDKFDSLLTTLGEIVAIAAELAGSAVFKLFEMVSGMILGGLDNIKQVVNVVSDPTKEGVKEYFGITQDQGKDIISWLSQIAGKDVGAIYGGEPLISTAESFDRQ